MKTKKNLIVLLIIFFSFVSISQIPNNGFENWTNNGSENDPDSWSTSNSDPFVSVTPYSPAYAGNFSLKVETFSPGFGILPGIAEIEFPYFERPNFLKACIKTNVPIGDKVVILLSMTNGDSLVASSQFCTFNIDSTISEFTCFNFPISYISTLSPTLANITIAAGMGNQQIGTFIIVDEISFENTLNTSQISENLAFKIYPNPFTNQLSIDKEKVLNVKILNSMGQVLETHTKIDDNAINFETSDFPLGNYFVRIETVDEIIFQKCIKL